MPSARAAEPRPSGLDPEEFSRAIAPGDDFYLHVNQSWLEETEIPPDRSNYGSFSILDDRTQEQVRTIIEEAAAEQAERGTDSQKVGDFFRSFTDVETRNARGIGPLEPLLEKVRSIDSAERASEVAAELTRAGVDQPLAFYIAPDARDSDSYAVYLTQSGLTLPDRDYYLLDDANYPEVRAELQAYIADMLRAVGEPDAEAAAERIVDLEKRLAAAQWTNVENRDPIATYNKTDVGQLETTLRALDWQTFARGAGFSTVDSIIVRQPSFFERVGELTAEVPLDVWKEYLTFRVIDGYAPYLTEDLERRHFEFHQGVLSGVSEQKPLWKRGVELSNGVLGELIGRLYVREHFPPQAKQRMEELVDNLKRAFAIRIDQLDWMSPGTKKAAHEKLEKFTTKIGYPDKWKDYQRLKIEPDDLVGNLLRSADVEHQRDVDKLGGPIDRTEWHMTPQTINAYYNPTMNEIVFPAAILQPPFFDMEADDAVNYGGIGAVIGHEISHGFDDKGSRYDGDGNLRNWWTQEDREEFERRAAGLVEQYSRYSPIEGMHLNGELTLGENIGDLGGLSTAYTAYRLSLEGEEAPVIDGLTGDQRFFLGWSQIWRRKYRDQEMRRRLIVDPHSPSQYRVNGIVSNMDPFYDAFDISPDAEMYIAPEDRVRIW